MRETDRPDAAPATRDDAAMLARADGEVATDDVIVEDEAAAGTDAAWSEATGAAHDDDEHLLDDELEHGIASVFAALHAAAGGSEDADDSIDAESFEDDEDGDAPLSPFEAAEGKTFRLLGELDRLWHRAA